MNRNTDYIRMERKNKVQDTIFKIVVYLLLAFWAFVVLFPFYYMILTSVKSYGAYNSEYIPKLFTLTPTIENYMDAFTGVPLGKYFFEYRHFYGGDNGADARRDRAGGICFRKTQFPRQESCVHAFSCADDDSK